MNESDLAKIKDDLKNIRIKTNQIEKLDDVYDYLKKIKEDIERINNRLNSIESILN